MGSANSRFRTALIRGEQRDASKIWREEGIDFRQTINPNEGYSEDRDHNTPFLLASKHCIESILYFFYEQGADPNRTNSNQETALHLLCSADNSPVADMRRAQAVERFILGSSKVNRCLRRADIDRRDKNEETALHWAARAGLRRCVEVLVGQGSDLFVENARKETPCDCASKANHFRIAEMLESRMVFSGSPDLEKAVPDDELSREIETGLKAQEVQEVKDKLLIETSDMLGVPLFTAEALLRNHEWSKEVLLEGWMENSALACEKAGVKLPDSDGLETKVEWDAAQSEKERRCGGEKFHCSICVEEVVLRNDRLVSIPCGHSFCDECWEGYLNVKIQEGDAHNIKCPAQDCNILVPLEIIEKLVSRDMARRYLHFDIKAFVESNPGLKWCPFPGCKRVVRYPAKHDSASYGPVATALASSPAKEMCSWRCVDCGNGHQFCWGCLKEAHDPCPCDEWRQWHLKVQEMLGKEKQGLVTLAEKNATASSLWLMKHSKHCPKCKSPIQRTEGCNHVACTKCKHDFCWVCLEEWRKHSSSTGGYFRCNKYEIINKLKKTKQESVAEASSLYRNAQELHRFEHFHDRFANHSESSKIEENLLTSTKHRLERLAKEAKKSSMDVIETGFFEAAVNELLKARRVLRSSYALGYHLTGMEGRSKRPAKEKRAIFESMQTEVEDVTERLAQMVNRPHLRTPRGTIVAAAATVRRKRQEFIDAAEEGFLPGTIEDDSSRRVAGRRCRIVSGLSDDEDDFDDLSDDDDDDDDDDSDRGDVSRLFSRRRQRFLLDSDEDEDGVDSDDGVSPRAVNRFRDLLEMLESITSPERICTRDSCQNVRQRGSMYCSERCAMIDRGRRVMNRIMKRTSRSDSDVFVESPSFGRRHDRRLRIQSDVSGQRPEAGGRRPGSPLPVSPRRSFLPLYSDDEDEGLQRALEMSRQEALRDSRTAQGLSVNDVDFLANTGNDDDDDDDADFQLALRLSLLEVDRAKLSEDVQVSSIPGERERPDVFSNGYEEYDVVHYNLDSFDNGRSDGSDTRLVTDL
eukprot:m.39009 g.39009  ORF g.39009 m.39009 type:complete len:1036 (+) comp32658_c0_seq5:216-3323(+)